MQKNKRVVLAFIAMCLLVAGFSVIYLVLRPQPVTGSKSIDVEIMQITGESKTVAIETNAEYLREALEEYNLIEGEEGQFGLYVKAVDGVTADDGKQEWWCFTKGGAPLTTGVDDTPIANGEHYEITLKSGY